MWDSGDRQEGARIVNRDAVVLNLMCHTFLMTHYSSSIKMIFGICIENIN